MEFAVAKALKPSLRSEFVFQQTLGEELFSFNANTVVAGEDFSVDDLLDFSNGDDVIHHENHDEEEEEEKDNSSLSSHSLSEDNNSSNSTDASYDSIFSTELLVPDDDVAGLEWVSHFVDDSLPELSLLYPVQIQTNNTCPQNQTNHGKTLRFSSEKIKITKKTRTMKNRKPNPRVWALSPLLLRPFFSSPPPLVSGEPPAKKQKKKAQAQDGEVEAQVEAHLQRRCSHCQVQKTPQWRTGPLGAKTLCNACGVRYKSGRLFSEYRPACSPTFSSEIHSNSHRKVLEMRRRKGMVGPEPGLPAQTQMVTTC
ncbi:hypothetical protein TSUD_309860 [Trifolium subterraneum]|uniref:GATA transcription factor n=1 Tax=Trifolium subterraneum TaxID=3900 RepID=A0A2Z6M9F5_TRISU|nr:hypothetical protein TSUD_309860 [Trifolium subterraneum]